MHLVTYTKLHMYRWMADAEILKKSGESHIYIMSIHQ